MLFLYSSYIREFNSNNISFKNFFNKYSNFEPKSNMRYYSHLKKEFLTSKSYLNTLIKIPKSRREIFIMAYQSYLFNECIKSLLISNFKKENIYQVKYNVDNLLFIKNLNYFDILNKTFTEIGRNIQFDSDEEEKIILDILNKEDVTFEEIKKLSKTGNFLKTYKRNILFFPKNFKIIEKLKEKNNFSVKFSYELPKGSYATIVIKSLFEK